MVCSQRAPRGEGALDNDDCVRKGVWLSLGSGETSQGDAPFSPATAPRLFCRCSPDCGGHWGHKGDPDVVVAGRPGGISRRSVTTQTTPWSPGCGVSKEPAIGLGVQIGTISCCHNRATSEGCQIRGPTDQASLRKKTLPKQPGPGTAWELSSLPTAKITATRLTSLSPAGHQM